MTPFSEIQKARILIVDDEEHIRTLYTLELEDEGHQVLALATGKGLGGHIETFRPDVVVLDIKMVDVSGLEERIRFIVDGKKRAEARLAELQFGTL